MERLIKKTIVILLAGGRGERLSPLTEHRAKPAVPFGGKYRIIDFILSNCIHSGLKRIYVLPQYKFDSLLRHLSLGWDIFNSEMNECLRVLPPQMRVTDGLIPYVGTADAVYQNLYSLRIDKPEYILILSGDQIYRMDYRDVISFHQEEQAELTIAAVKVDREVAQRSGVLEITEDQKVINFEEKPKEPKPLPIEPERFLVSMGIYVFNSKVLIEELEKDKLDEKSEHDFGENIIPKMIEAKRKIFVFLFGENSQPVYWRDIGTVDSYFEANMDLVSVLPQFNLYDQDWSWRTFQRQFPPSKIVFGAEIKESIISEGCVIDESRIYRSILSPGVRVEKNVEIVNSIIMDDVVIKEGARIIRAIIDKENVISPGSIIDAKNMKYEGKFEITPSRIVAIPRHYLPWRGD